MYNHRVLPFIGPVYFGGLPSSFIPIKAHPFDYYTGCMKDVHVDRVLIDFLTVHKVGTILNGCPQYAVDHGSCQVGCDKCLKGLWNGATCLDNMGDSKSLNGNGYLTLGPGNNLNIEKFEFQFRTLQENIALSQISYGTYIHVRLCTCICIMTYFYYLLYIHTCRYQVAPLFLATPQILLL